MSTCRDVNGLGSYWIQTWTLTGIGPCIFDRDSMMMGPNCGPSPNSKPKYNIVIYLDVD